MFFAGRTFSADALTGLQRPSHKTQYNSETVTLSSLLQLHCNYVCMYVNHCIAITPLLLSRCNDQIQKTLKEHSDNTQITLRDAITKKIKFLWTLSIGGGSRQACSSQIQYLSNSTKITTNTETAMLSRDVGSKGKGEGGGRSGVLGKGRKWE